MRAEERNEPTMTYFRYSFINYSHLQEKEEKEKKEEVERSDFDYKWH